MNKFCLTIDTLLYLLMFLFAIHRIYNIKIKRRINILIDICIICALLTISFIVNTSSFIFIWIAAQMAQIILIYTSNSDIQLTSILVLYIFIYSINSILVVVINGIFPLSLTNMAIVELIVHIIFTICFLFCCLNNHICSKIQKIISNIPPKIKYLTSFALCTSAVLMALILSNPDMYINSSWSISVRIALIFFSLFICTTFPILIITVLTNTYLKKQNENFERELEAQAEHYVALAESNKELRRFKHDFKNLRIGITKALTSGDCEIALEMIENGQNDFIQATDSLIKFNTGNGIVDAILSEKQKKATASNTIILFEGIIPQTGFSPTDLCVIFGNTLDNAIEACEKISVDTKKTINISVNCAGGFVFISITNPVTEKVTVHNNHIETTKKDRSEHGFGLYSLEKIAQKYDGEMNIVSEEHTFTLTLELCL